MHKLFWNIVGGDEINKHKMRTRRQRLLLQTAYWFFLTHLWIFCSIYWFTHRLLGNLMPVRVELTSSSHPVISILTPTSFVWSEACCAGFILVVESYLNTWPLFHTAQNFRFELCQEYITCLQYLKIPPSSPGTVFSLEWIWREEWGSVWQVEDERPEKRTFWNWGGFDLTGLWWSGKKKKKGLENWNILMWKNLRLCRCGIPCDNKCKYSTVICIHVVTCK